MDGASSDGEDNLTDHEEDYEQYEEEIVCSLNSSIDSLRK